MSPRYVQTAASHLRSAYKWGIENELVAKNPVRVERVQASVAAGRCTDNGGNSGGD